MVGAALLVFTGHHRRRVNQVHLGGAARDHRCAHHRDDEGSMVAADLHAPQPREEVDLRRADPHGHRLHHPDDGAVVHDTWTTIGTPIRRGGAGAPSTPRALNMSLRAFHLVFIGVSVVLAAFVAAWAVGQYRPDHAPSYAVIGVGVAARAASGWPSTARRSSGRRRG